MESERRFLREVQRLEDRLDGADTRVARVHPPIQQAEPLLQDRRREGADGDGGLPYYPDSLEGSAGAANREEIRAHTRESLDVIQERLENRRRDLRRNIDILMRYQQDEDRPEVRECIRVHQEALDQFQTQVLEVLDRIRERYDGEIERGDMTEAFLAEMTDTIAAVIISCLEIVRAVNANIPAAIHFDNP